MIRLSVGLAEGVAAVASTSKTLPVICSNRDVEGPAAQVVDQHVLISPRLKPWASAAAVGSLTMRLTSKPASPASFTAARW